MCELLELECRALRPSLQEVLYASCTPPRARLEGSDGRRVGGKLSRRVDSSQLQTIQSANTPDMSMSTPLPLSNPLNELREGTNGTPDTFSSFVSGCATPNHPNRARVLPSPPPTSVGEIGASPLHTSRPESPSGLGRSTHTHRAAHNRVS